MRTMLVEAINLLKDQRLEGTMFLSGCMEAMNSRCFFPMLKCFLSH